MMHLMISDLVFGEERVKKERSAKNRAIEKWE